MFRLPRPHPRRLLYPWPPDRSFDILPTPTSLLPASTTGLYFLAYRRVMAKIRESTWLISHASLVEPDFSGAERGCGRTFPTELVVDETDGVGDSREGGRKPPECWAPAESSSIIRSLQLFILSVTFSLHWEVST